MARTPVLYAESRGRATSVQRTRTPVPRREREMSRDAATKGLLAWTAKSKRTPGAQNDEGGKIRGLLALGQEQRAGGYRLSGKRQSLPVGAFSKPSCTARGPDRQPL